VWAGTLGTVTTVEDVYVSISEAARRLGVGRTTVRNAANGGTVSTRVLNDGTRTVSLDDVASVVGRRPGAQRARREPSAANGDNGRPYLEQRMQAIEDSIDALSTQLREVLELIQTPSEEDALLRRDVRELLSRLSSHDRTPRRGTFPALRAVLAKAMAIARRQMA